MKLYTTQHHGVADQLLQNGKAVWTPKAYSGEDSVEDTTPEKSLDIARRCYSPIIKGMMKRLPDYDGSEIWFAMAEDNSLFDPFGSSPPFEFEKDSAEVTIILDISDERLCFQESYCWSDQVMSEFYLSYSDAEDVAIGKNPSREQIEASWDRMFLDHPTKYNEWRAQFSGDIAKWIDQESGGMYQVTFGELKMDDVLEIWDNTSRVCLYQAHLVEDIN
jgi:hypothetical protein